MPLEKKWDYEAATSRDPFFGQSSEQASEESDFGNELEPDDIIDAEYDTLDEDTYGMGIAAIIKDSFWIVHGHGPTAARALQFISAMLLIVFTIALQGYFIWELQHLVSSVAVTHARKVYEEYEVDMYAEGHTYKNSAGHLRGEGGPKGPYFRPENFHNLTKDFKDEVCAIPFSQPGFFAAVLIIWTLTVMNNLKRVTELMYHFCYLTPTVTSVKYMLKQDEEKATIVEGLTLPIKFTLFIFIGIPRTAMNTILLWRGTRYLAATFSFADLLLNAIALEFILLLKDLLWTVAISDRNKREVANIRYVSRKHLDRVSGLNYIETWIWLILALVYVGLYFVFQQTLPNYNWDVRDVCKEYVEWKARG